MKSLFFLLVFFSNSLNLMHDVPLAKFHITESNARVQITIFFDVEDFSESLNINAEEVNRSKMQNYLDKHTSFQFNTQVTKLNVSEVSIVRDHIKVKGIFNKKGTDIKTIKIENTCLNNISSHSNIIQIDLNNQSKDYRMHKKRTVINLNLDE